MRYREMVVFVVVLWIAGCSPAIAAVVEPGELITPENVSKITNLVSPGNYVLVEQGMRMKIVPTGRIEWPPYYNAATEKYAPQVRLNEKGELENYVAGLPFPFVDQNDPQAATKIVWNFSYRPETADDVEIRNVEMGSYRNLGPPGTPLHWLLPAEAFHLQYGHVAWHNNIGRTEVLPIPSDPNARVTGIRYRFAAGPIINPSSLHGRWLVRFRYVDPEQEDNAWYFSMGRVGAGSLSATFGPYNLDPDSYFGFAAKVEDFNYRLLGIRPMLASVHAQSSPARPCPYDDGRTVCAENWELRHLYVIEATPKPLRRGRDVTRRILYIDSEGWFITASDQWDLQGSLWKTLAVFNAYRDRSMPRAQEAIYPFKRMFETAIVDEDIQSGFSTVAYLPGSESDEREGWFIDTDTASASAIAAATAAAANRQPTTR